jgi:hypothetical protein
MVSARCACFVVRYCPSGDWRGRDISRAARPSVRPSHMLVAHGCGSGALTKLGSLYLRGSVDGTIPTEM